MFFILIQMILFLIFEYKLHFFQHKILVALAFNAWMITGSSQVNPFLQFILLQQIFDPMFKRYEKQIEDKIKKAFEMDVNLDTYRYRSPKELEKLENRSDLPGATGSGLSRKESIIRHVFDFFSSQFFAFFHSIAILSILIRFRDSITPDIFHFLTCVEEEEVHYCFIMIMWMTYKCFLTVDPSEASLLVGDKLFMKRVKIVVRALIELGLSLLLMKGQIESLWIAFFCYSIFVMTCIRAVFYETLDLLAIFFVVTYFIQNFIVNMVDWIIFRKALGYYTDQEFNKMFSYKLF
jgi:hypothetical protein